MQNTNDTTISILVDHIKYNPKAVHNISPGKAQLLTKMLTSSVGMQLGIVFSRFKKLDLRNMEIKNKGRCIGTISVERKRIVINIFSQTMIIPMDKVIVQAIRSGEELRVSAEIENVDLDGLVESLAREYCSGNIIISCLVKALNEKSRGKKVKILQKILTEMLKHGVVDAFLDNLKKRKDSLGQKLNELELEIGNIAIDDLSIDAAE